MWSNRFYMEVYQMNSNTEHLTFDEMVEFVCYDKYDDSFKKMAVKNNSHLFKCHECARVFNDILATKKAFESYANKQSLIAKVKFYAISALLQTDKKLGIVGNSIEKMFDSFDVSFEKMRLSIANLSKIEINNNSMGLCFTHPTGLAYSKSYGNSCESEGIIESVLIDGKSKIRIDLDGTLIVELDEKYCSDGMVLFLLPLDDNTNSYVSIARKISPGLVRAEFEEVEPGEYQIVSNMEME